MHAHEWDSLLKWIERSRLRMTAFVASIIVFVIWLGYLVINSIVTGKDKTVYCDTKDYQGFCLQTNPAEWNLHSGLYLLLLIGALFAVPALNGSILLTRGGIGKALGAWNEPGLKRARLAEAKSADLEAELARMDRQLDSLGVER